MRGPAEAGITRTMHNDESTTTRRNDSSGRLPVVVKVFGALRTRLGAPSREIEVPVGGTVRDLLRALASAAPDLVAELEKGLDSGYLNVLVDGRHALFLDGLDTRLDGGETVAFLPPVAGG